MIVGIIARSDLKAAGRVLGDLIAFLNARNARCIVETATARLLDGAKDGFSVASGAEMGKAADVLVVFGGDGTLLRASHLIASNETLVLGVNFGSLGFLTEIASDELEATLADVLAGNARFENRSMLSAAITRGDKESERHDILNDVVVSKASVSRIIEFDVSIDRIFVSAFRADGLIISSPTGSTAYNLAAGGPILHPDLAAVLVTPICPHMLSNRPLVVADSSRIEVKLRDNRHVPVHVSFDGESGVPLETGDTVVVTRSARVLRLVRSPRRDYYDVLRAKLKWGDSAVRRP